MSLPAAGRTALWSVGAALLVLAAGMALPAEAQTRPAGGGFGSARTSPADDALIFHVLSRCAYGPDEATLAEIRSMGVDAWLWQQLHPETIDDSVLETRLSAEMPPIDDQTHRWAEMTYTFLSRQAFSRRQLQSVMTQFWENHFDTQVEHGNTDAECHSWSQMERKEDDALRANAFGRFRQLIEVSAKSQAMMYFLDNYQNTVRTGNENYARELLELHSLGVDCGYTQFDVEQVARIFTGWTGTFISRTQPNPADPLHVVEGDFFFNGRAHDTLAKPNPSNPANARNDVLGTTFPPGGYLDEGLRVLDIVSAHPCTARFISTKLLRSFVMDAPPAALVDRIAGVYMDTDGDIRQVLWAIFRSPEFRDPANFGGKVKTPIEQVLSALRATGASMAPNEALWLGNTYYFPNAWYDVYNQGQRLFYFNIPTGYPEVGTPWISANGFLSRWKYADQLTNSYPGRPGTQVSVAPMATATRLRLTTADEVLDHFAKLTLGMPLDPARRALLRAVLVDPRTNEFNPTGGGQDARLRETISQMLGFPEFNEQ